MFDPPFFEFDPHGARDVLLATNGPPQNYPEAHSALRTLNAATSLLEDLRVHDILSHTPHTASKRMRITQDDILPVLKPMFDLTANYRSTLLYAQLHFPS